MIDMDNSATTRPASPVIQVVADVMQNVYGNPSSLHGAGAKAERLVKQAREITAKVWKVDADSIVYTSGGTEANNLAIKGSVYRYGNRGRHLITSSVEHASVMEVFQHLEIEGWEVTYIPVDEHGLVSPDAIEKSIRPDTVLVSIMHVNNEVGTIQPIAEIGRRLRKYPKALFHVDAVQSFGKWEVLPIEWEVDLMSISAHKFHGPKGVGALYLRPGITLSPLLEGGGQEKGLRSGTLNVPGIVGMAKAASLAEERREAMIAHCWTWKKQMLEQVKAYLTHVQVNGPEDEGAVPFILSFSFLGLKSEVIVHALEEEGVLVSSKSACSSKKERASRILTAMGRSEASALGTIRISMGQMTTGKDVEQTIAALRRVIPRLQQIMKV